MLTTSKELSTTAQGKGYAVGAFNSVNMESTQAIFSAAEEERSPFIIQITQTTLKYTDPEELFAMILSLSERATVPHAIHLDHGRSFDVVMRFLRLGMTSVMIDGSLKEDGKTPQGYEDNIAVTRKVVEAAHAIGVSVEGEIGNLGQIEQADQESILTDPDEAARFVADTGVDLLAVAIGTKHGLFKGTPKIYHERVAEIAAKVNAPLVMHGGTGVPDDAVRAGVKNGIAKINIDTQIRVAFYESILEQADRIRAEQREADQKGAVRTFDIRGVLAPAREAMTEAIRGRMQVFGSSGRA